ncbi:hypothetical protein K9L67_03315 [Candidatus Woesearchaeota archaeon]|nr:hypothetical protein [Candidatus Woesearchaeota archaeon]MCF7901231.1 hypothetical protein [Candidatus Woesearchaeota archaeon]MCF8013760.1 hypothetical protein [Candidatus Woesearchaeota archaeon]
MVVSDSLKFTGKDKGIVGGRKEELIRTLIKKLDLGRKYSKMGSDLNASVPSVFIGSYNYPSVKAGFLSTQEYSDHDSPLYWSSKGESVFGIPEIVGLRSDMLNSNISINVGDFKRRIGDNLKEISLASIPVDSEIRLDKKPNFSFSLSSDRLPHGPSAALKNLTVSDNPKVPNFVEKVAEDVDLKANTAVSMLSSKGVDEHYITKIFSAGNLGLGKNRKLVPTKWSITAVDDSLGKFIAKNQIVFNNEADFQAFFGGYMGNYYIILTFPGPFRFELFETYVGKGLTNSVAFESASDYEGVFGRKNYASNTVGGYYACKMAVLEYLRKIKKKASVIALRFITDEYWVPLGVWVVREATRKALSQKPIIFSDEERLLKYSLLVAKKKYNLDLDVLFKKSKLIFDLKQQKSLSSYFNN